MDRRNFLTRSGLALGAIIVGDEVLEAMDRLTHVRKSFPSAGMGLPRYVSIGIEVDPTGTSTAVLLGSTDNRTFKTLERVPVPFSGEVTFSTKIGIGTRIDWVRGPQHGSWEAYA